MSRVGGSCAWGIRAAPGGVGAGSDDGTEKPRRTGVSLIYFKVNSTGLGTSWPNASGFRIALNHPRLVAGLRYSLLT